jgi:hypothetical protein
MLEMFGGHDVLFPGPIVPVIGDLKDCTCFEVELGVVSGELDRSNDVLAWARDDDSSALGVVQVLLNRGRRVVVVGGDGAIGAMDVDAHVPTLEGGGVGGEEGGGGEDSGPGTSSSLEGQLDTSVVGVADRCLHVSAVDDVLHVAPLYTEVVKLVSSAVAEGGGPGVVVFLFKACGCDDQLVFEAEI